MEYADQKVQDQLKYVDEILSNNQNTIAYNRLMSILKIITNSDQSVMQDD